MTQSNLQSRQLEKGFTLVELAIVMIIIGLLIGGILKGQELIANARVSSTASQIKATESGISGFRDKYNALPGDLANATGRLPSCQTAGSLCISDPTVGTLGNGLIENTGPAQDPGLTVAAATESGESFIQLAAAGFIGGVQPAATAIGAGVSNPVTPLGGSWTLGSSSGTATGMILTTGLQAGVYMAITPALTAAIPVTSAQSITPSAASNIDRKIDDGLPNTGIVRATGLAAGGATACTSANTAAAIYNEALGGVLCGIYAKVQ